MEDRRARILSELAGHAVELESLPMRALFEEDAARADRFVIEDVGLCFDYAKQRIRQRTMDLLVELAEAWDLASRREAMFTGEKVNVTEGRAALHTALRSPLEDPVLVDGEDVMPGVHAVLGRMRVFTDAVRSGAWRGATGERIRHVVNIGIGGSDLGPAMAATALDAWREATLEGHFVSNLDGAQLEGVLRGLDPARTLFVIASKTFTTQETITNARSARRWLVEALGSEDAVRRHFVAVSTNTEKVRAFGIDPANMFGFWDWVGGRYSLWSAIGLSVALLMGMDTFERLLAGAHAMDVHFRRTPLARNLPVVMGLLGIWNTDYLGAATHAVLVYDWALRLLPAHLQQLEMESNGKCVRLGGRPVEGATCPVLFGGPGNNGQHAYYQLIHQGTQTVPSDVIVAAESQSALPGHQDAVLANALAQTEAFMLGQRVEGAPYKTMPGNRPSTTILYHRLTPEILGSLVALYEHKVFVQSVIWDINPFDQWGVELGKELASRIAADPAGGAHDGSTLELLRRYRELRGT